MEITRAAQAQLAAATPISSQLGSYTFLNDRPPIADNAPEVRDGALHLNKLPGLGVTLTAASLGQPAAEFAGGIQK